MTHSSWRRAALLLLALCVFPTRTPAAPNDHIFPPAPAAKSAIDFDSKGFLVHGQRTFIVSAGMEYARVPRAQWHDRLLRLKRAGFNCVEIYTFWNFHEPQPGVFNFSGDHDLDAYLKMVHELGLYAIVRVGPYYCAEWDSGGYPLWLRFQPGVQVRVDNAVFEDDVDRFFGKLIPIVAANQINRGGSVILVQLENEHPAGWGTAIPNGYFQHLKDKAVALGIEVPTFFSGLHHGSDPAGRSASLDDPQRPNPWMTTEFWSVWFDHYGPKPEDPATYDRRTWKIIAHGGNGYNYYMAYGGSNFDYSNDNEDAASYDYGAAVGQAGDLRPLYYTVKRAALFARTFQDVLENSAAGDSALQPTDPSVQVNTRHSSAGDITFLDNPGPAPVQTQFAGSEGVKLPAGGPLTLAPGEILPVVQNFPIASVPGVSIASAPVRIMTIVPQGNTTTIVIYGAPGSPAEMRFNVPPEAKGAIVIRQSPVMFATPASNVMTLSGQIPVSAPAECSFTVGTKRVRILAVSDSLAARTWTVDVGGQNYIVCGPSYVGEASVANGRLSFTTERAWQNDASSLGDVYGPNNAVIPLRVLPVADKHTLSLPLSAWQTKSATDAAAPDYNDHNGIILLRFQDFNNPQHPFGAGTTWAVSDAPLPMGADGDLTCDAWYRTTVNAPAAGNYTLQFGSIRDRALAFVDGKRVSGVSVPGSNIALSLAAGAHTLAIFTAHDGRDKLYGYLDTLDSKDAKGLTGPALLEQPEGPPAAVTGWRVLKLDSRPAASETIPAPADTRWANYTVGTDAYGAVPGFAYFQATLPALPAGTSGQTIHFESADDNATVFLNGQRLTQHRGWNRPFDVSLARAWNPAGPNVLTLLVENTTNTGGIDKPATFAAFRSQTPVTGWRLRGGPDTTHTNESTTRLSAMFDQGWTTLPKRGLPFDGPQFYKTRFTAAPPAATGPHPIWRVVTTGLGHGSVWVNGHNLGRYPEKIPINGLYVPECWLNAKGNSLVIYDEDGQRPDAVTVQAELAASRTVETLRAP